MEGGRGGGVRVANDVIYLSGERYIIIAVVHQTLRTRYDTLLAVPCVLLIG